MRSAVASAPADHFPPKSRDHLVSLAAEHTVEEVQRSPRGQRYRQPTTIEPCGNCQVCGQQALHSTFVRLFVCRCRRGRPGRRCPAGHYYRREASVIARTDTFGMSIRYCQTQGIAWIRSELPRGAPPLSYRTDNLGLDGVPHRKLRLAGTCVRFRTLSLEEGVVNVQALGRIFNVTTVPPLFRRIRTNLWRQSHDCSPMRS